MSRACVPTHDPDTVLCFRGDQFRVCSRLFALYSARFAGLLDRSPDLSTVAIESDVSSDSVVQFIEACQFRPYTLTVHNAHDLDLLCQDWDVPMLCADIESFMNDPSHEAELLIPSLLFLHRHSRNTSVIEAKLRTLVPTLLSGSELLELPLGILCRILSREWTQSETAGLFEFLLRCLGHFGGAASLLFGVFDLQTLSVSELEQLRSRPDFRWELLGGRSGSLICDLIDSNLRLRALVDDQRARDNREIARLQQEVGGLRAHLDAQNAEFADLRATLAQLGDRVDNVDHERQDSEASLSARAEFVDRRLSVIFGMWNRKDPFRILIKDKDGVLKAMTLKEKTRGVIDDSKTNLDLQPVTNSKLQLFRQGEDANVIVSVVHSGYVWDGTWIRENQLFYCSGKHGCWNQRFCCRGFIHEGAELWHLFCVSFPSMVVTWMADERKFQMRSQHVDLNSRQTFQIKFDGS